MPPPRGRDADVVIVGAGIAGASAAYFLAPHASVIVLEREEQPGYHTTGRSAALFAESYGNDTVRALTRASRAFFTTPPAGFSGAPLLEPRGHLIFSRADQKPQLDATIADIEATETHLARLTGTQVRALVPALRPDHSYAGALDPGAQDVDVHALLHGFLRGARAQGVRVHTNAAFQAAEFSGRRWRLATTAGEFSAGILVNAGGAWADEIARASRVSALGLSPLRRTVIVFDCARHTGAQTWPMSVSADESLYFRPEAGGFLASPADETLSQACDARPEELDVALVIDRLQTATTFDIRRVRAKWAGLRTFAADRSLIAGFDMHQRAFFWLAGQGGYGIQTSPAMGMLAAMFLLGSELPNPIRDEGFDARALSPSRFGSREINAVHAPGA